jgi:hypothetical protein
VEEGRNGHANLGSRPTGGGTLLKEGKGSEDDTPDRPTTVDDEDWAHILTLKLILDDHGPWGEEVDPGKSPAGVAGSKTQREWMKEEALRSQHVSPPREKNKRRDVGIWSGQTGEGRQRAPGGTSVTWDLP